MTKQEYKTELAKSNNRIGDVSICIKYINSLEAERDMLLKENDELKKRISNAVDSAMAAQHCMKVARVNIYKVLERVKYILTASPVGEK